MIALRHSFVSLLSDDGDLSIDEIAKLCGHAGTTVTETVYRHQIRPVIQTGAPAMNRIFDDLTNVQRFVGMSLSLSLRRSKRPLPITGSGL
ncbi:hypothetical protein Aros01_06213 [Streptosporangium roseum]